MFNNKSPDNHKIIPCFCEPIFSESVFCSSPLAFLPFRFYPFFLFIKAIFVHALVISFRELLTNRKEGSQNTVLNPTFFSLSREATFLDTRKI